jgi:hypothetical protein
MTTATAPALTEGEPELLARTSLACLNSNRDRRRHAPAPPGGPAQSRGTAQYRAGGPARVLRRSLRRQHRLRHRALRWASSRRAIRPLHLPRTRATGQSHGVLRPPRRQDHHRRAVRGPAPGERHHRRHERHELAPVSHLQRKGAALWVVVWTSVGYFSGSHIDTIYNEATRYSTYFAVALGALPLTYIARRVVRSRRARPTEATPGT